MAAEKAKRIIPYVIILLVSLYFYYLAGQFRFSAKPGNLGLIPFSGIGSVSAHGLSTLYSFAITALLSAEFFNESPSINY